MTDAISLDFEPEQEPAFASTRAEHMADAPIPEVEGEAGELDGGEGESLVAGEPDRAQIDEDQFHVAFSTAFELPGHFVPDFKPLAIQDHEKDMARGCSTAVYRLLEIYFPTALKPQSENLMLALAVAPFAMVKAQAVRGIMQQRRAAALEPPKDRQPTELREPREVAETPAPAGPMGGSPLAFMDAQEVTQ